MRGFSVALQWLYSGFSVALQWLYSGSTVALQWLYSGSTVGLQWVYNGKRTKERRCEPHGQIKNKRTKYPLPNHILSYSETTPKERECSNGKVRRRKDEEKTNNERTNDEQSTNNERTMNEQKAKVS